MSDHQSVACPGCGAQNLMVRRQCRECEQPLPYRSGAEVLWAPRSCLRCSINMVLAGERNLQGLPVGVFYCTECGYIELAAKWVASRAIPARLPIPASAPDLDAHHLPLPAEVEDSER